MAKFLHLSLGLLIFHIAVPANAQLPDDKLKNRAGAILRLTHQTMSNGTLKSAKATLTLPSKKVLDFGVIQFGGKMMIGMSSYQNCHIKFSPHGDSQGLDDGYTLALSAPCSSVPKQALGTFISF